MRGGARTRIGLEQKMVKVLQEAYRKVWLAKYEAELAKAVTVEEIEAFKVRWAAIADRLADGWILNDTEV